ncbi:MAG: hypothetical protein GX620_04025 [Chloroflexi bacterium]|nr:hypothetical protein [Chloroflexota bacterium]
MSEISRLGVRELLDEKRALEAMIERMSVSMARAADWLISEFAPAGPIMREHNLSYCHKVVWGLYEDGRLDAVERLLDWIAAYATMGIGRYGFPEEPPFHNEMQLLYRFLTFAKVAERLRHPAFANDETREEVLTYQHACGGVFGNKDHAKYMGTVNPLTTSFFTQWALAAGLMEPAIQGADFLAQVVDLNTQHMTSDPGKFYFNYDPKEGALVTTPAPGEEINCFVDTIKPKQHFYYIGTAMAALADVYAVNGEARYLEAALRLAEFERRLNPQGLQWPSYCKVGWGAAELYAVTEDPMHRIMAANVSDVTFMTAQTGTGGWAAMYYPLKDQGAWESVQYNGASQEPNGVPADGSWALLAGHEITGEFMGEMGRTLAVFKAMIGLVENRLRQLIFSQ